MKRKPGIYLFFILVLLAFLFPGFSLPEEVLNPPAKAEADMIIKKAFDHMRGETSTAVVEMTIHRSSWERQMTIKGWTKGQSDALFFIESPPKDAGNGTLKLGPEMWTYNPKINRVIKLPPSMMSQSWMGSDFSNNDLAKSDSILTDYTHSLINKERRENWLVYTVRSVPRPDAPVIWGKQESDIREDGIMLRQAFFDEDGIKVKEMITKEIGYLGGRLFPKEWIMRKADEENSHTKIIYKSLEFDTQLSDDLFKLSSLSGKGKR